MPKKKLSSATSRDGVNYVRDVVEHNNCIFNEITLENDFGNDCTIEFVDKEQVTGVVVAAQIKSGNSYVNGDTCLVPSDEDHFKYWARHTLSVLGIVFDKSDRTAYWTNISDLLKHDFERVRNGPFTIRFDKHELNRFDRRTFREYILPIFLHRPILLNYERSLTFASSDDLQLQGVGVYSLSSTHFDQESVWAFLVDLFRSREPQALHPLVVHVLARIPGHPDIAWTSWQKMPPTHLRELVKERMRAQFGRDELEKLLSFVDPESLYARGSPGQDVQALVSLLPGASQHLYEIAQDANQEEDVRVAALPLYAYLLQERSLPLLEALSEGPQELAEISGQIRSMMEQEGFVYLD